MTAVVACGTGSGGGQGFNPRTWRRSQQWLPLGAASAVARSRHHHHAASACSVVYLYYLCGLANAGCKEAAGSGAAALVTGSRRWPEHGPRLPAAFPVVNLPIYFSSGDDRRMQRARATTARYGRDSAAAGQGARARSRQRAEGATVGCTNGEASQHPGASADQIKWGEVRGSSAYNCNLRLPAIRRKLSVPALASCLHRGAAVPRPGGCFVGPPTRPEWGKCWMQGSSGKRGSRTGHWHPPVAGARPEAACGFSCS